MAFAYYRSITIDHTKVPGTLSNFPVLVSISDATFKTVANGGHVQHSAAYDVCFFADSAATTALDWGVESFDAATGVYIAWVKVPSVSSSSDTTIYVFYGDAGISTPQSTPTAVWDSNFKAVYHLQTISGAVYDGDATSNGNNATNSGTTAGTAIIDGGAVVGGEANLYVSGSDFNPSAAFTLSGWVYIDSTGWVDPDGGLFGKSSAAFLLYLYQNSGYYLWYVNGSNRGSGTLSTGAWHYLVMNWDASDYRLYIDGNSTAAHTYNSASAPSPASGALNLGAYSSTAAGDVNNRRFKGKIDEFRFSSVARSTDWMVAEYNNQLNPGTFYSLGLETANAVTGTLASTLGALTVGAAGTVAVAGTNASTLGAVTSSAAGTVAVSASTASTLGDVTVSTVGTVSLSATLASALEAVSASAAASVAVAGSEASTLDAATTSAAGAVAVAGTLAATLDNGTVSAAGTAGGSGTLSVTLDACTATAAGTVAIAGSTAATLGACTASANGTVAVSASLVATLGDATVSAAGSVVGPVEGSLSATLGACSVSAAGTVLVNASLAVTLGNTTLAGATGIPVTSIRVRNSLATPLVSVYAARPLVSTYTATPDIE